MERAMFDITRLDVTRYAEEGVDVHIINPADKSDTGVVIKVMGVFAPRFKELLRKARKTDETNKSAGNDEAAVAEMLAEVTLGWNGVVENGKSLAFSREEASRVYQKYALIRSQVFDAALDVANFVKG
jgi:hypothetical protein